MPTPRMRLQDQKPSRTSWYELPPELRNIILECFKELGQAGARISAYAAVCHEWQAMIEPATFNTLVLHQSDVQKFRRYTKNRGHLIKHVWLRYELERYDYPLEGRRRWYLEDVPPCPPNHFQRSIRSVLNSLRSWDEKAGNLTLELSIHSPSDSERWFPHFCFSSRPDQQGDFSLPPFRCSREIWHMLPDVLITTTARAQVFGQPLEFDTYRNLPKASVVKHLIIRRETRRNLCCSALEHLFRALPALETVHYEPWSYETYCAYGSIIPGWRNPDFLFRERDQMIPSTIKHFTLFEDRLPRTEWTPLDGNRRNNRQCRPQRSLALATASLHLESMAVSFAVDALSFFTNMMTEWRWENLRLLSLTSGCLQPTGDIKKIYRLLLDAAHAADRMPKLETMELWNGEKCVAGLFQYHARDALATLLWRGTWHLGFPAEVVSAWKAVASNGMLLSLRIKPSEPLNPGTIGSYGDAIVALDLKIPVARPVSVQQIQWELGGYLQALDAIHQN